MSRAPPKPKTRSPTSSRARAERTDAQGPKGLTMATITGSEVLAQALRSQGVDTMFYLMGGPMLETEAACIQLGIRAIDHRHEQAAAFAAHAWTRVTRRPGVCMAASGPGATNLLTGVATAFTDAAPLVALGGARPRVYFGLAAFPGSDQLAAVKPLP